LLDFVSESLRTEPRTKSAIPRPSLLQLNKASSLNRRRKQTVKPETGRDATSRSPPSPRLCHKRTTRLDWEIRISLSNISADHPRDWPEPEGGRRRRVVTQLRVVAMCTTTSIYRYQPDQRRPLRRPSCRRTGMEPCSSLRHCRRARAVAEESCPIMDSAFGPRVLCRFPTTGHFPFSLSDLYHVRLSLSLSLSLTIYAAFADWNRIQFVSIVHINPSESRVWGVRRARRIPTTDGSQRHFTRMQLSAVVASRSSNQFQQLYYTLPLLYK